MIGAKQASHACYLALQAIQHRGQDAAGVGTWDGQRWHLHKDLGLISQAIPTEVLERFGGEAAIAHVRYPTAGANPTREDAQPFLTRRPGILLAHNGNVTNMPEVGRWLLERGTYVLSSCDAEPIMLVLATALTERRAAGHTADDVVAAVREVYAQVRGAYSVVAVLEVDGQPTMIAFRDPHGIRPGCYGRRADGAWLAASESVALDVGGFEKVDDIPPGRVLFFRAGQEVLFRDVVESDPRPCIFERIYFARPDSVMEDGRVNRTRWLMGRRLAKEWAAKGHPCDVVVAVPDTSRPAAQAMAEELGVKNREGFIKNRYSGRTFIMPDQATREAALRLKLNPVREIFHDQHVVIVDDSIVRGTTMRRLLGLVRKLGPKSIHVAIFAPAVRHPCFYGIDMPSTDELAAAQYPIEQVEEKLAEHIGADSLTFLSLEGVREIAERPICMACFDGDYIVPVSAKEQADIIGDRRP